MRIHVTEPPFAWDELQDNPSLATLQKLLAQLRRFRGKGRNDYPVEVLRGVLVLTSALRYVTIAACLAELQRNAALRRLIGIPSAAQVPKPWNMSRFMAVLDRPPHADTLHAVFDVMLQRVGPVDALAEDAPAAMVEPGGGGDDGRA